MFQKLGESKDEEKMRKRENEKHKEKKGSDRT